VQPFAGTGWGFEPVLKRGDLYGRHIYKFIYIGFGSGSEKPDKSLKILARPAGLLRQGYGALPS
jgi:hypothetical protein